MMKISFPLSPALPLALALTLAAAPSRAQYVTPGTGQAYGLDDLVAVSQGALQSVDGEYFMASEITIAAPDRLEILADAVVRCAGGTRLSIEGRAIVAPPTRVTFVSADTAPGATPFINVALGEGGGGSLFRNMSIEYGCGLKISEAQDVVVEDCRFYRNRYHASQGSGAVSVSGCSPVIRRCQFVENTGCGVISPANVPTSPTIDSCLFWRNVTDNGNLPQINLGPALPDTVFITRNTIVGHAPMSGGISLATLAGGSITAVVSGNEIRGNRYGINQYGNDVVMFATANRVVDNNLETVPNNGGSGITVYCTSPTSKLYATGNYIKGNLWGITLVGAAQANLGNPDGVGVEQNAGLNVIVDNGNGGVIYNLYNNSANAQIARNNYWGFATAEASEAVIWHAPDISSLGLVDYAPVMQPLSGVYHIPGDFPDLALAFDVLNAVGLADGGVELLLANGVEFRTAPLMLTATGSEAAPIVVRSAESNGDNARIVVAANELEQAALTLVGSDYVTVSGLDFEAANELLSYGIALIPSSSSDGCHHNTVERCSITMDAVQAGTIGVYSNCLPSTPDGNNSHNSFTDINISHTHWGFFLRNGSDESALFDNGNVVSGSFQGGSVLSELIRGGVYAQGQKSIDVHGLVVRQVVGASPSNDVTGIMIDDSALDAVASIPGRDIRVYSNLVESLYTTVGSASGILLSAKGAQCELYNNVLRNIQSTSGEESTSDGIRIDAPHSQIILYNNMISGISAAAGTLVNQPFVSGVHIVECDSISLWHNSIALSCSSDDNAFLSAALYLHDVDAQVEMRNNLLVNIAQQPIGGTGVAAVFYKNGVELSAGQFSSLSNNNLLFAGEPSAQRPIFYAYSDATGVLPVVDITLEAYQERMSFIMPGMEQRSVTGDPSFTHIHSDLHISTANSPAAAAGASIADVPFDIDGDARHTTPDIGADEFSDGVLAIDALRQSPRFALVPNPASGVVRVGGAVIESVIVFDAAGRKVLSFSGTQAEIGMDISALSQGVYVVLVNGNESNCAALQLVVSR